MGFLSLLAVASMPVIQVMLIGVVGAFLASGYSNVLTPSARRDVNKLVFTVFTPCLMFASLAKTVTLSDAISWWFMPVNIAVTFLAGTILGWIACKILKPPQHFRGLIIAFCSTGNLGTMLLVIVPAVCDEDGNLFGTDRSLCRSRGLSYSSLSTALGSLFIWTYTYSLMQMQSKSIHCPADCDEGNQIEAPLLPCESEVSGKGSSTKLKEVVDQLVEVLMSPPTISVIVGFVVGLVPWLKSLLIGDAAPLRVLQDSLELMGNGTIPCMILILGGNLTQGLRKTALNRSVIAAIVCIRYVFLPVIGMVVVQAAHSAGFLPRGDPLFRYTLMMQFALPPAMYIGTIAQLFDVGKEECSVIFLWTYLVAAAALTAWSTAFMSILS